MDLEILCRDAIALKQPSALVLRENTYDLFLKDVKEYARLKNNYDSLSLKNCSSFEKEKIYSIQDSLFQKEKWYDQQLYGAVDIISNKINHAKKLSDFKSALSTSNKVEKICTYVDVGSHIQEKNNHLNRVCETAIESYVPRSKKAWDSLVTLPKKVFKSDFFSFTKQAAFVGLTLYAASYLLQVYPGSDAINEQKNIVQKNQVVVSPQLVEPNDIVSAYSPKKQSKKKKIVPKTIVLPKNAITPIAASVVSLKEISFPVESSQLIPVAPKQLQYLTIERYVSRKFGRGKKTVEKIPYYTSLEPSP